MIEAYEIGISLALQDGVSDGIALIRRELASLDQAIAATTANFARLQQVAGATTRSPTPQPTPQPPLPVATPDPSPATVRNVNPAPLVAAIRTRPDSRPPSAAMPARPDSQPPSPAVAAAPPPPIQAMAFPPAAAPLSAPSGQLPKAVAGSVPMAVAGPSPAAPQVPGPVTVPIVARPVAAAPAEPRAAPAAPRPAPAFIAAATLEPRLVAQPEPPRPLRATPGQASPPIPAARVREPAQDTRAAIPHHVAHSPAAAVPASVSRIPPDAPLPPRQRTASQPDDLRADFRPNPAPVGSPALPATKALVNAPAPITPPSPVPTVNPTAPAMPASFAPPPPSQPAITLQGDIILDGARVGRWMTASLARQAARPPAGPTGPDPRQTPLWSGQAQGF